MKTEFGPYRPLGFNGPLRIDIYPNTWGLGVGVEYHPDLYLERQLSGILVIGPVHFTWTHCWKRHS